MQKKNVKNLLIDYLNYNQPLNNKEKLEQSFKNIQTIQLQNVEKWQNENKGWKDSTEKKDEYIELVSNVMSSLNKDKMIKELSKEVLIKK